MIFRPTHAQTSGKGVSTGVVSTAAPQCVHAYPPFPMVIKGDVLEMSLLRRLEKINNGLIESAILILAEPYPVLEAV